MKRYLKHIILFLTLLPMMTACVLDSDPTENCSDNEVVVSLSVSSRAVEGSQLGDGLPDDIKLWVYGQATSTDTDEDEYRQLAYINKNRNIFIGRDLYGNPVESLEQVIEDGKNYYRLHFYVVLNSNNVTGTNVTIGETTTITQLKALTFSGIVQSTTVSGKTTPKKDNQMIMYGYNSLTIGTQTNYELSIQVERAVAKLELFFAKEFENSSLYINSAKLTQIPTIGALISGTTLTTEYTGTRDLSTTETTINATLESSIQIGNFSQYEDSFHKLALSGGPYLLENPNGETWGADKNDYTYPETAKGGNNVYKLTVKYTLNGTEKEQEIYLPKIERNHLYKIYARVMGGNDVQFKLLVQDWDDVNVTVPFSSIISYTVNGWNRKDGDYLAGNEYYITKNGNAEFLFRIDNPQNCTYTVELTDNINFSYKKDTYTDENSTIWQKIIITPKNDDTQKYATTMKVFAIRSDNGKSVELDVTKTGGATTDSKDINHYIIKQEWTD